MAIPYMSDEDRTKALNHAKAMRTKRAQVLRDLSEGKTTVAALIEGAKDDEVVGRIKVISMLKALPGYGDARAHDVLDRLGIAESRRLRGLGIRQRTALLELFS